MARRDAYSGHSVLRQLGLLGPDQAGTTRFLQHTKSQTSLWMRTDLTSSHQTPWQADRGGVALMLYQRPHAQPGSLKPKTTRLISMPSLISLRPKQVPDIRWTSCTYQDRASSLMGLDMP